MFYEMLGTLQNERKFMSNCCVPDVPAFSDMELEYLDTIPLPGPLTQVCCH